MSALKRTKVMAGMYEIETPEGTARIERVHVEPHFGTPGRWSWMTFYPERFAPDADHDTLRDAVAALEAQYNPKGN